MREGAAADSLPWVHNQTHAPQQWRSDVLIPAGLRPTKPGWLSHRRVLGLSLEGESQKDAYRVEGSSKANFFAWQW